uniref:Uncharacterized protein n=1 Tax=Loa loa TaxID=7209 RepID=A0A1I7VQP2_LOALO
MSSSPRGISIKSIPVSHHPSYRGVSFGEYRGAAGNIPVITGKYWVICVHNPTSDSHSLHDRLLEWRYLTMWSVGSDT